MLWGLVIGIATVAATAAAAVVRPPQQSRTPLVFALVLALALACAYGAYELALFAATPFLGGAGSFTPAIIGRMGSLNVAGLIGLAAACEIVRPINPFKRGHAVSRDLGVGLGQPRFEEDRP